MGAGAPPASLPGFAEGRLWHAELGLTLLDIDELPWDVVEEYGVYLQLLVQRRAQGSQS